MKLFEILKKSKKELNSLALKIKNYNGGAFSCDSMGVVSLVGCPSKIINSYFSCAHNKLLTTLEGGPSQVDSDFYANDCNLTTLEGGPSKINGDYMVYENKLQSLKGAPQNIVHNLNCSGNSLTSLEGAPQEMENFSCNRNKLTSLKGVHKIIKKMNGVFSASTNPITSHVLGILLIKGCRGIELDNQKVVKIVNKYLPNNDGMVAVLKCQEELFAADLDEYAQL